MKKQKIIIRSTGAKGFTLVEVLVAVIILSIGILGVSQMTVMGIKVNTVVNQRMYARVVMATVFENLNNLPSTHAWLADINGNGDLNITDSVTADHFQRLSNPNVPYSYMTVWNVADTIPEVGMKTIRIWVLWGVGLKSNISTDLIKRI